MLRIAICDDQLKELESLKAYIIEYLDIHTIQVELREFLHPDNLLKTMEKETFHLYLLDIVMPMVSGIELGKEIRRFDHEAQIIYITTEPQFALQAYVANPLNYLIKPLVKEQLFETLSLAIAKIELSGEQTFTVKTTECLRVLKLSHILCCEYRKHAVVFTLLDGEELISRTIRERFAEYSAPILKDAQFLHCHTSYVVNMRWVERFTKDSFTMRGGKVIPIAATQYSSVRDQCMNYLMAREDRK